MTAAPPIGVTTRGTCVHVVDGDTIDVEVRYVTRVRLFDCWAPEKNTTSGRESAAALKTRLLNQPVVLFVPTSSARSLADVLTFDRVLGYVWVQGEHESISEWLVRQGYATKEKLPKQ